MIVVAFLFGCVSRNEYKESYISEKITVRNIEVAVVFRHTNTSKEKSLVMPLYWNETVRMTGPYDVEIVVNQVGNRYKYVDIKNSRIVTNDGSIIYLSKDKVHKLKFNRTAESISSQDKEMSYKKYSIKFNAKFIEKEEINFHTEISFDDSEYEEFNFQVVPRKDEKKDLIPFFRT